MNKLKRSNTEKGITLIALIITVVVLLILATVSISSIQNDNIISHVNNASTKYNEAQTNEKYHLSQIEEFLNEKQTGVKVEQVTDTAPGVLEGSGTEADPYVINSIEDLVFFAYDVTNGNNYSEKIVNLGLSLDFNSIKSYVEAYRKDYGKYGYNGELKTLLTSGEGFIPIGTTYDSDTSNFWGTFNGQGNIINNLYINKNLVDLEDDMFIGLFSKNYGIIKKLGIINTNINLVFDSSKGKTENIGVVTGGNCKEISECYTSGKIISKANGNQGQRIGSMSGTMNTADAAILNCYNNVDIITEHNSQNIIFVGGISGYGLESTAISGCYNLGNISGNFNTDKGVTVGGIVSGSKVVVTNCYNMGAIKLEGTALQIGLGGIKGTNFGEITNCANVGNIISEVEITGTYNMIGGITGQNYTNCTITDSYYLKGSSSAAVGIQWGEEDITEVDTITEMPSVLEIVGSAFKADTNNINNGYPILSWQ